MSEKTPPPKVSTDVVASPAATTTKKRQRKVKKEAIVISLWINKVKYEHGICKYMIHQQFCAFLLCCIFTMS